MKQLLTLLFLVSFFSVAHAQNLNNAALLATDPGFQLRVQDAILSAAVSISNEPSATVFHSSRDILATNVLTDTSGFWAQKFAAAISASDAATLNAATQNGTVVLTPNVTSKLAGACATTGNLSTQAALVTDAQINNAVSATWNSFFAH